MKMPPVISSVDKNSLAQEIASAKAVYDYIKNNSITLNLASYYNGVLPYVSPYKSLTYASRQAAPNITSALQAMIADAQSRQSSSSPFVFLQVPAGLFTVNRGAITLTSGLVLNGMGNGVVDGTTQFRTVDKTGNLIEVGITGGTNSVQNAGVSNIRLYQDHGGNSMWGWQNPAAGSFINKNTSGSIIYCTRPNYCIIDRVATYGGSIGIGIYGGSRSIFSNLDINGIWDITNAIRQEGFSAVLMTGPSSDIPTWHRFPNLIIGGDTISNITVNYPGSKTKPNSVMNIGFYNGWEITCAEEVYGDVNISACAGNGIIFKPASTRIIQDVKVKGTLSPCGTDITNAYVKVEAQDTTCDGPSVDLDVTFLGQGNGYRAVSDYGNISTRPSFARLNVRGDISSFVGNPVYLNSAGNVTWVGKICDYNVNNFYTGDDACGLYWGANSKTLAFTGAFGGAANGTVGSNFCIDGIRAAAFGSSMAVNAANAGLSGYVFLIAGEAQDRLNEVGNIQITTSASFTFDLKSTSKTILVNSALTANMTITMPTLNVPDGFTVRICRSVSATGAFNIVAETLTLSAVNTMGEIQYKRGVGWITTLKGLTA